jgi:class 3 adenylate cyclase
MIQVPTNFNNSEISDYDKITTFVINPCIKNIKGSNSEYFNNIKVPQIKFINSVLVSKLKIRNVIIGYIFLFNKEDNRKFEDKDKYIIEIISTHSSLAFERVITLEKMKEESKNILKLQRFLPRKAISKILNENTDIFMNGSIQNCTVLFSDITEFMKISKNLSPVQIVSLLNDYFTVMTKVIFSFNGTISKFIGDKILAVFGIPLPSSNHCLEAVLSSLEMKKQEKLLKEKIKEKYKIDDFNIRIGINSGPVLYGNIGAPQRMEFTVMGATVNITNKITEMAKPDNIFISNTTYEKVKGIIKSNFINKLKIKHNQDIEIYQIFDKTDSELFVKLEDKNINYNIREHVRIDVKSMVVISKGDIKIQGTIKDISLGGVSIKVNSEFKKGDEINITFKLSNDILFENIPAIVRHVNPGYNNKDGKSVLGVQFVKLSDEDYINLVNYIDKKIF